MRVHLRLKRELCNPRFTKITPFLKYCILGLQKNSRCSANFPVGTIPLLPSPRHPASAPRNIRLSGNKSFEIVNTLFPSKDLRQQPSHTLHVGFLKEGENILDEVVDLIIQIPEVLYRRRRNRSILSWFAVCPGKNHRSIFETRRALGKARRIHTTSISPWQARSHTGRSSGRFNRQQCRSRTKISIAYHAWRIFARSPTAA